MTLAFVVVVAVSCRGSDILVRSQVQKSLRTRRAHIAGLIMDDIRSALQLTIRLRPLVRKHTYTQSAQRWMDANENTVDLRQNEMVEGQVCVWEYGWEVGMGLVGVGVGV